MSGKVIISAVSLILVVGGKVVTLKSIEESSHIVMQETPMQVSLLAKC